MRHLKYCFALCLLVTLSSCNITGTLEPPKAPVNAEATAPAESEPAAGSEISSESGSEAEIGTENASDNEQPASLLSSPEDIGLHDVDGSGGTYSFIYAGESFTAYYWTDNWRIIDSYKITSESDITIICEALAETNPVHSADYTGYRTAEDMAYEWIQHNKAYEFLPDGSSWKESARDVDLDPADQGKSMYDIFIGRLN